MLVGCLDHTTQVTIGGWAADSEHPNRVVWVIIKVDWVECARIAADRPRSDLLRLGIYGAGNHGFLYTFNPPLSVLRQHHITVHFADSGQLLPEGEVDIGIYKDSAGQAAVVDASEEPIKPIMVTAMGRSGTTLLMQRLLELPDIVAASLVPFEVKLATYYASVFRVLTTPADHVRSSHPDHIADNAYFIGYNPYFHTMYHGAFRELPVMYDFYQNFVPMTLRPAFRQIVEEFYKRLRRDQGKIGAVYFAEKCDLTDSFRLGMRFFFGGVKEIILIRDLRDVYCSFKSYFKLQAGKSTIDNIKSMSDIILRAVDEMSEDYLIVRYESLVLDPTTTMREILLFLELGSSPVTDVNREKEIFDAHATSSSAAASIGRWRTELSPDEVAVCDREFGRFQAKFGYHE
jgi:hypothetical protein